MRAGKAKKPPEWEKNSNCLHLLGENGLFFINDKCKSHVEGLENNRARGGGGLLKAKRYFDN